MKLIFLLTLHSENARVMVLGATNRPAELDEAILRRFSQVFEIGRPDCNDREKILKVILKNERVEDTIDFDHIARLSEGYTGSDLLELCKQAAYIPLRDLLNEEKAGKIRQVSIYIYLYISLALLYSYGECLYPNEFLLEKLPGKCT